MTRGAPRGDRSRGENHDAVISTGPVENSVEKEVAAAFRAHQPKRFFALHKICAILSAH
jgi:hypothetical protein